MSENCCLCGEPGIIMIYGKWVCGSSECQGKRGQPNRSAHMHHRPGDHIDDTDDGEEWEGDEEAL